MTDLSDVTLPEGAIALRWTVTSDGVIPVAIMEWNTAYLDEEVPPKQTASDASCLLWPWHSGDRRISEFWGGVWLFKTPQEAHEKMKERLAGEIAALQEKVNEATEELAGYANSIPGILAQSRQWAEWASDSEHAQRFNAEVVEKCPP